MWWAPINNRGREVITDYSTVSPSGAESAVQRGTRTGGRSLSATPGKPSVGPGRVGLSDRARAPAKDL